MSRKFLILALAIVVVIGVFLHRYTGRSLNVEDSSSTRGGYFISSSDSLKTFPEIIRYTPPKGYYIYNPSIFLDDVRRRIYYSCRLTNKSNCPGSREPDVVVNKLVLTYVDTSTGARGPLNVITDFGIYNDSSTCNNMGVEDVRLWALSGRLYGIGTYVFGIHPKGGDGEKSSSPKCINRMVILEFDPHTLKLLNTSKLRLRQGGTGNEKNWSPVINRGGNEALFVYSWNPFVIIRWDSSTNEMVEAKREELSSMRNRKILGVENLTHARGSSQIVHHDKLQKFIGLVHTRDLAGKTYRHYFVELDQNLNISKVSDAICVNTNRGQHLCGIEFVSGASVFPNGDIALTYGLNDCEAKLAIVNRK